MVAALVVSIRRVLVEEYGHRGRAFGNDNLEGRAVEAACGQRGIPVVRFHGKDMRRGRVPVDAETMVTGSIPSVEFALTRLGVKVPEPNDYPDSMAPWLHRRVWISTVGAERAQYLNEELLAPRFVKPKGRLKRFTGFVAFRPDGMNRFEGTSAALEVWCSEPVAWRSEWRAYVTLGEVRALGHYDGRPEILPDRDTINAAVAAAHAAGELPAGCGVDFGVLDTGATALVECNDGYGLGNYLFDAEAEAYFDTLAHRWTELAATLRR